MIQERYNMLIEEEHNSRDLNKYNYASNSLIGDMYDYDYNKAESEGWIKTELNYEDGFVYGFTWKKLK